MEISERLKKVASIWGPSWCIDHDASVHVAEPIEIAITSGFLLQDLLMSGARRVLAPLVAWLCETN